MTRDRTGQAGKADEASDDAPAGVPIDRPRLTPQNRTGDEAEGEDATDPAGGAEGGAKAGQGDKAEG